MRWAYLTLVAVAVVASAGCTRVVDAPPPHQGPPVAPIAAGQVADLLSPDAQGGEGSLFTTVDPEHCSGLAREVDPPFIVDLGPAATDGGHWRDSAVGNAVVIEEMVGVYRADFEPREALAQAQRTIDVCRDTPFAVTAMSGDIYNFTLTPAAASDSPAIVLWSMQADNWACDNALVAAHNAAVEITACARTGGYDVLRLAQEALNRIDALANTIA